MFSTNQALVLASSLVLLSGYQLKMDTGREFSIFAPVLLRLLGLLSMLTVSWFCWPRSLEKLDRSGHQDLFLLGLIGFCIIFTITTQLLVSSGSIGALLSGMLIKQSRDHSTKRLTDIVMEKFYPIQQMLSALFFASLGMLVSPSFMVENIICVLVFAVSTALVKIIYFQTAVCALERKSGPVTQAFHMGEFAVVLAGEGLYAGFVPENVSFFLVGVTAVSVCVTPVILKAVLLCQSHVSGRSGDIETHCGTITDSAMS
mmetsp:Transcript_34123/g.67241  ORF Transcript_34123/g.67241 Transcript_34123/m.67241 type:complete len:259 (+) Transcript_34123:1133-1909(+)